jgi:calcineurin-like phosphoesterase family protein
MIRTYITSDTYFGRRNMIKYGKRKYSSVEEMDKDIIERWNSRVNKHDVIYHLGNFAWDPFSANIALQNLNGKIRFMYGNKDKALVESASLHEHVQILHDQIVELKEFNVVMCHYPLEYWNGKEEGSIHLHGHNYEQFPIDLTKMLRMNVCLDYWNLYPVNISDILELVQEYMKMNVVQ